LARAQPGAVKDLMDQGKVLHLGLSEMGLKTLRRAHVALPVKAVQNEYSMLCRGPEKGVIPVPLRIRSVLSFVARYWRVGILIIWGPWCRRMIATGFKWA
jgi:aryl-alcohol dehydrogenase-like predicted oxidoreductase